MIKSPFKAGIGASLGGLSGVGGSAPQFMPVFTGSGATVGGSTRYSLTSEDIDFSVPGEFELDASATTPQTTSGNEWLLQFGGSSNWAVRNDYAASKRKWEVFMNSVMVGAAPFDHYGANAKLKLRWTANCELVEFIVNGSLVSVVYDFAANIPSPSAPFHIGAIGDGRYGFNGTIKNFKYTKNGVLTVDLPLRGVDEAGIAVARTGQTFTTYNVTTDTASSFSIPSQFSGPTAVVPIYGDSIMEGSAGQWVGMAEVFSSGGSTVYNRASGGTETAAILTAVQNGTTGIAATANATGMVFNGGVNDTTNGGYNETTTYNNLVAIAQEGLNAGVPVAYVSLMPKEQTTATGGWTAAEQVKYDSLMARFAQWCNDNGVQFVDAQTYMLDPADNLELDNMPDTWYSTTGAVSAKGHLSQAGAERIAAYTIQLTQNGAVNPSAYATKLILDSYPNITATNRISMGSFLYRQHRLGQLDEFDLLPYALNNATDALKSIKGVTATLAQTGGNTAGLPTHTVGIGYQAKATNATNGSYIVTGWNCMDWTPDFLTQGYTLGAMTAAMGTVYNNNASLIAGGGSSGNGILSSIVWNTGTPNRYFAGLDTVFGNSANFFPATNTIQHGKTLILQRPGSWTPDGPGSNQTLWLGGNDVGVPQTINSSAVTTARPTGPMWMGANMSAFGAFASPTTVTFSFGLIGTTGVNPKIINPADGRAGLDLLYTKLDKA